MWSSGCSRIEGAGEDGHASGVPPARERRDGAAEKARRLAGAGAAGGRRQFAGRAGGVLHPEPSGRAYFAASLPGQDECDRSMVLRWVAASFLATEKNFRRTGAGRIFGN
jgi:hypothetical protein